MGQGIFVHAAVEMRSEGGWVAGDEHVVQAGTDTTKVFQPMTSE